MDDKDDLNVYTPEHLIAQAHDAPRHLGYAVLQFYVDEHGLLSKQPTERMRIFYLSPSGGTLRDEDMNIVLYSAKFDRYKGYGRL